MTDICKIPAIDEITAPWLTVQLRAAGFEDLRVKSFASQPVGTGQGGSCYRIALDYEHPQPDHPRTVIAKFPTRSELGRRAAVEQKIYLREVQFFRQLAPRLSLTLPRLPRNYYAQINGHGPEYLLLLEDAAPAVQGDQIKGCSTDFARWVVPGLVGLHAPSWHNPAILGLDWLIDDQGARNAWIMKIYRQGLPHFVDRCGTALTRDELKLVERVAEATVFPSECPAMQPHCLVHSDYRLDNMLIDERTSPPDVFIVDWQTMIVGNPMRDASYFLGGCLTAEQRTPIEKDLVRDYHSRLLEAGASGYPWQQCWDDYRQSIFHGIMTAVVAMLYATQTERGDVLFRTMGQRHARQALQLGAAEFIQ
ncbi:MAG TPA: phosphotransferase [Steroidobacteraceae bacterium]|nr:phosphotransferase [Steroidobacteraceae bacterium]